MATVKNPKKRVLGRKKHFFSLSRSLSGSKEGVTEARDKLLSCHRATPEGKPLGFPMGNERRKHPRQAIDTAKSISCLLYTIE